MGHVYRIPGARDNEINPLATHRDRLLIALELNHKALESARERVNKGEVLESMYLEMYQKLSEEQWKILNALDVEGVGAPIRPIRPFSKMGMAYLFLILLMFLGVLFSKARP